jgi:hypothetical protein
MTNCRQEQNLSRPARTAASHSGGQYMARRRQAVPPQSPAAPVLAACDGPGTSPGRRMRGTGRARLAERRYPADGRRDPPGWLTCGYRSGWSAQTFRSPSRPATSPAKVPDPTTIPGSCQTRTTARTSGRGIGHVHHAPPPTSENSIDSSRGFFGAVPPRTHITSC